MNAVLFGGPFDGESRDVPSPAPDSIRVLDSVVTMELVLTADPGDEVRIDYKVYRKVRESEAGIWRYEFAGTYPGHFVIGDFVPE
jgi:hypothetical protein